MTASRLIDEKTALNLIRSAAIAAVISGVLTVFVIFSGAFGFTAWNFIDAAVFFGLAYGVYRKSRTCAVILLVLHLANRFDMWTRTHNMANVFGLTAIGWFALYLMGILGTFAYHSIQREKSQGNEGGAAA